MRAARTANQPNPHAHAACPHAAGFTLAELLLALAILGVIATFTIPKILTSVENGKRAAVMKEVLSMVETATYDYALNGYREGMTLTQYRTQRINAAKQCNNALSDGCWTAAMATTIESSEPGLILHNGAYIAGFFAYSGGVDGLPSTGTAPRPPTR